jgi:HD superfamily phosphohydrolase
MLDEYIHAIDALAAEHLAAYTAAIRNKYASRTATPKEFNDPVWGTLSLSALEVLLVDSPLIQRLRRIRQLGVVHWVYPSATHTRFEHSIGALHLTKRLLDSAAESGEPIPEHYCQLLRIAALCHDVGHGVMSHVSENALRYCEEVEDLLNEFAERHGREASLGEINSFLLVGTSAFTELIHAASDAAREAVVLPNHVQVIQDIIIGKRVDPEYPVLHQLISGPFDADKLDYMTRDAYMSGVPLVTDVNRLIRKVRSTRISLEHAPTTIQRLSTTATETVVVLAIHASGNRTLDELTLGRTLLFDKIYRHHKSRAFEVMVASMLTRLSKCAVDQGVPHLSALQALVFSDDELIEGAIPTDIGFAVDEDTSSFIAGMARRLSNRDGFVRSIQFSRKMTDDPYDQDDVQALGLQELLTDSEDAIRRRKISLEIAAGTEEAISILGMDAVLEGWAGSLSDYIWLDGAGRVELTVPTKAMLLTDSGKVVSFEQEAPETPQWAIAYQQTRDSAIVFCPQEIVVPTALAAERFVRKTYGVRLPVEAIHGARSSHTRCRDERVLLAEAGYYDDCPSDLKPKPARLLRGDTEVHVKGIATRLHGYCPPLIDPEQAGRDRFHPGLIESFVEQFQDDELIDSGLNLLGQLHLIDRHDVVRPLLTFLGRNPEFERSSLVVLGSSADSSSIATYFGLDAAQRYPDLKIRDLGGALIDDRPILFVDDLIGSGRQAASVVHAWFGELGLAEEMGEARFQLLPAAQEGLKQSRIAFCFAAGLEAGPRTLNAALEEHGVSEALIHVGREEDQIPNVFGSGNLEESARQRFVERCGEIGVQLLVHQDPGLRDKRKLGYGNLGLLLTFPYNTPSQTLTCLWERGVVDGRTWTPLLPRRRKR